MNTINNLPFTQLLNLLSENGSKDITFDNLKEELLRLDENDTPIYNVILKEEDDLCMIYYSNNKSENDLGTSCRSYIIDKKTLKPIATQFNKIIRNDDAIDILKETNWDNVVVQKCYEGTMLLVYNHSGKWYVSTRRYINANESCWIRKKSYGELFEEAREGKFEFDDLNPDYCYHMILVHHENKNIVCYDELGSEYKELYHVMTTEKYTLNEITDYYINDNIKVIEEEQFDDLNNLLTELKFINRASEYNKRILSEGFILKVYDGEVHKSNFKILKLQTEIYKKIASMKPNNSNEHQSYLELYQKDKLMEVLPYFTQHKKDIIRRLHQSMKMLSQELLDLYYITRKKGNPEIYSKLKEQYKKALFNLHGIYIQYKSKEFNNNNTDQLNIAKSINIHNVYNYLKKSIEPKDLRQMFYERRLLLSDEDILKNEQEDDKKKFLNRSCEFIDIQTELMFGNN